MESSWKNLVHIFVTFFFSSFATFVVGPAIADVTLEAVCPGQDECSIAIYLTGFQQAIGGLGSIVMMPLIGNLSDAYGRKNLLTLPLTLAIFPLAIMAVSRTTPFFYAFYVLNTITSMVCTGGVACIAFSYLADNVPEGKRVSAIGLMCGIGAAATVCSTIAARLLPTSQIFQVAAVAAITAAAYMRIFLVETNTNHLDALEEPILKASTEVSDVYEPVKEVEVFRNIPSPKAVIRLLKTSTTVSLVSFASFFNSVGEAGVQSFLMYYLKAQFHFQKDQYADICLITYIGSTFANMVLMPTLGPLLGVETLLSIGLLSGFLNMFFDSIAWAPWVPYASSFFGIMLSLVGPCIKCIVSKEVGPNEQGIAQGCLMGISSLANVASPLIYSPLSALFLSDNPPLNFRGFSILCVGLSWLIGFILSLTIKILPHLSRDRMRIEPCLLA